MIPASYDAIVIGAGIGGLGLSAFLAKGGRRVLTLEKAKHIGGRAHSFTYKGHTLNIGGPRAGLEHGEVDALFAKLGAEMGERAFFDDMMHYRDGYPLAGYMASNVAPSVSPQGEHLFEVSCICDAELGDDREFLREKIALMKEDLEEMFPGWESTALWVKPYFHWVESARTPGREGVFRPGPRAPGVAGLYFTGDTVSSRALPGLETAADSAMICAREILGELP